MCQKVIQCLAAAIAAAILVPVAPAAGLVPVKLGPQALWAGQIRTVRLIRLESAPRIAAYGVVLDPGPLAMLASQVIAGRASASLARSEAQRATSLYRAHHNISQAALQIAQAGLETSAATYAQLQTRMLTHWGRELSDAAVSARAPVPALETGTAALVEVSLPLGQALARPPTAASATTPDGETVQLRFISRAPRTASGVAGQSLFYLMPAQPAAPIGTPLTVSLETAPRKTGVLVPQSAVIWHQGGLLAFRETSPGVFLPVPIRSSFISGDGYFVPEGRGTPLHPGDRIVTGGAALLYSAATQGVTAVKSAPAGKAEDGEDD